MVKILIYIIFFNLVICTVKEIVNNFIKNTSLKKDDIIATNFSNDTNLTILIENLAKKYEYNCLNISESFLALGEILLETIKAQHDIAYHRIYNGFDANLDINIIQMVEAQQNLLNKIVEYYNDINYHNNTQYLTFRQLSIFDDIKDGIKSVTKFILGDDIYNFLVEVAEYIDNILNTTILNLTQVKETLESYYYNFTDNSLHMSDTVVNIGDVFETTTSFFFGGIKKIIIIAIIIVSFFVLFNVVNFAYKIKKIFSKNKDDQVIVNKIFELEKKD